MQVTLGANHPPEDNPAGWKDVPMCVIFVMQFLFVLTFAVLGVVDIASWGQDVTPVPPPSTPATPTTPTPPTPSTPSTPSFPTPTPPAPTPPSLESIHWGKIIGYLLAVFGLAVLLSALSLFLLIKFTKAFIWIAKVTEIVLFIALGIFYFSQNAAGAGVIAILFALIDAFWLFIIRNRIPFAAVLLESGGIVVARYKCTIGVAFFGIFLQLIFAGIFVLGLIKAASMGTGMVLVWIFFYLWTQAYLKGTVHFTTAGTAAHWYCNPEEEGVSCCTGPVGRSWARAFTKSAGSIAFGGLLLAGLKMIRIMVSCCRCLTQALEKLIRIFNQYAYAVMAFYGDPYLKASRWTFEMITKAGLQMVVANDVSNSIFSFFILMCSALGFWLMYAVSSAETTGNQILLAFSGMLVTWGVVATMLSVVGSASMAVFVCFACQPDIIAQTNPELHARFIAAAALIDPNYAPPPPQTIDMESPRVDYEQGERLAPYAVKEEPEGVPTDDAKA